MNELPTLTTDPGVLLLNLKKLVERNPGHLSEDAFEAVARELKELVPKGRWSSGLHQPCAQVLDVRCDEGCRTVGGFYVEFRLMDDSEPDRLPIALFLETHRFLGIEML